MKTFTTAEIREDIDDLRALSQHPEASTFPQVADRFAKSADALEYLLQFVEWKPIRSASKSRGVLISDGFDGYAIAEWNEKYQNFADSSSIYPEANHYCELPPPPQEKKEGEQ